MFYLDYAKQVGDRYILNFFADSEKDLKDVPTDKPYITRNGTNYGVPLETSVVTVVENGVRVNYVLQNGAYIAGGDVAPVVGKLEATENKTYLAKDDKLDGYSQVVVNVQPELQEKSVSANGEVVADEGYYGLSKVAVSVQPKLQEKSVTVNGAVAPDDGFQGLSKVTVNVAGKEEQEKTAALAMTEGDQVVTPDTGKVLSKVTITKPETLVATNVKKDVNIGGVVGTLEAKKEEQTKTVTINSNGSQDVTPDAGKVLSKVTITTNVPATPVEEETVELALAAGDQIVTPSAGKNFSKITITKPTELKPENIKKGVTIAGVVGTYEAVAG